MAARAGIEFWEWALIAHASYPAGGVDVIGCFFAGKLRLAFIGGRRLASPVFIPVRLRCARPGRPLWHLVVMRRLVRVASPIRVQIADGAVHVIALAQCGRVSSR